MGGICYAALCDLAMRSCPPGLQGTLMMLVAGIYDLAGRGGDLLGAHIYNGDPAHGFLYCALLTMAVYALMLPVLLLIPKSLLDTADGQRNPALEAEVLAEIGASDEYFGGVVLADRRGRHSIGHPRSSGFRFGQRPRLR